MNSLQEEYNSLELDFIDHKSQVQQYDTLLMELKSLKLERLKKYKEGLDGISSKKDEIRLRYIAFLLLYLFGFAIFRLIF